MSLDVMHIRGLCVPEPLVDFFMDDDQELRHLGDVVRELNRSVVVDGLRLIELETEMAIIRAKQAQIAYVLAQVQEAEGQDLGFPGVPVVAPQGKTT